MQLPYLLRVYLKALKNMLFRTYPIFIEFKNFLHFLSKQNGKNKVNFYNFLLLFISYLNKNKSIFKILDNF